jgi:hypothetical protein
MVALRGATESFTRWPAVTSSCANAETVSTASARSAALSRREAETVAESWQVLPFAHTSDVTYNCRMTAAIVLALAAIGWAVAFYLGLGVGARAMAERVVGRKDKDRLVELATRMTIRRCAEMSPDALQTLSRRLPP